jgi:HlyD family secretion protein
VGARFPPDTDGFVELVWLIDTGTAHARQVPPGIQRDSHIEILGGLAARDQVVVGNYRAISKDLEDGAEVIVEKQSDGGDGAGRNGDERSAR